MKENKKERKSIEKGEQEINKVLRKNGNKNSNVRKRKIKNITKQGKQAEHEEGSCEFGNKYLHPLEDETFVVSDYSLFKTNCAMELG